jgi:glycosyltransferase involved in cell wall biosynthesis
MASAAGSETDVRIALNAGFREAGEAVTAALSAELPPSAFSYYHALQGTYPPPPDGDPVQAINAEIVRAHHASLQPDAIVTASVMEGFLLGDHCPAPSRLPGVIEAAVLYDLIPLVLADGFLADRAYGAFYARQTEVLRNSDLLLAISQSSADDAVRLLGIDRARVRNIGAAVPPEVRRAAQAPRAKVLPQAPYVLFAGGVDRNKNIGLVIEAFARLPEEIRVRHALVHVGSLSDAARLELSRLAEARGARAPHFLGFVDDETLINAYDHAAVFVFPSLYEGFGLPVLEAMTRGTPVLASRSSSLPEVVADEGALFAPDDPQDLSRLLADLLADASARTAAGKRAADRAEDFSWSRVARAAFEAIGAAVAAETGPNRRAGVIDAEEAAVRCAAPMRQAALADRAPEIVDRILASARPGAELGPPRLLVDVTVTEIDDHKTGIQRVVRETTRALRSVDGGSARRTEPIGFVDLRPVSSRAFGGVGGNVSFRTADLLLMLDSSWLHYVHLAEAFSDLRDARGTLVSTVYDLVPLLHPDVVAQGMREAFEAWFRCALLESDGLVCISRAVADEVVDYVERHDLPFRDGLKIGWWRLGSDLRSEPGDGEVRTALSELLTADAPVFLMVGTIEPRKRHAVVLDAFERLWREGSPACLLLLGKAGWNVPEFVQRMRRHPEAGRRLLWIEGASDAEVDAAYRGSEALIFASVYEGFGLPIVEAARMRLPVLASDIPVLREVGGDGAAYFRVDDPDALAKAVRAFLGGARPDPSRIRTLSWEESARDLLEVLFADRWYRVLRRRG